MGNLYGGKILQVDLTKCLTKTEPTAPYIERFLGGKGINAKLLFDEVEPDTNPFDAENRLIFGAGPLVGTPFPGACRLDIMAKSPVTGAVGDSGMGGYFAPELKFAGYDHIVIQGKAEQSVYLYICDNNVELKDASHIWGYDTYETPEIIRREIDDPEVQVVCIGPAGENLASCAGILSSSGNIAARTGLGAVMGSKKLKAIAVRGTKGVGIAQPKEFLAACQKLRRDIVQNRFYPDVHTWGLTKIHDKEMRFSYDIIGEKFNGPEWESISEVEFQKKYLYNRVGCFSCPVACFDAYNIDDAGGAGCMKCSPPGDLTWDVKNPDFKVFWKAYVLCQRYGIDARSLANMLNWMMELHANGIITTADTDGIPMDWGSPEAIVTLARKVSYREGVGDLLAQGLPIAAKKFGRKSEKYLLISKGSPSDVHTVPIKSRALSSSISPIGSDAQTQPVLDTAATRKYLVAKDEEDFQQLAKRYMDRAGTEVGIREAVDPRTTAGKAALVRQDEARTAMADISGICTWMTNFIGLPVDVQTVAGFLTMGLGKPITPEEVTTAGLRMQYLERAFQSRMGQTREDDQVSEGYYQRPKPTVKDYQKIGTTRVELETMKDDYYRLMGLDVKTGMPDRKGLEKLDMGDVADKLGL